MSVANFQKYYQCDFNSDHFESIMKCPPTRFDLLVQSHREGKRPGDWYVRDINGYTYYCIDERQFGSSKYATIKGYSSDKKSAYIELWGYPDYGLIHVKENICMSGSGFRSVCVSTRLTPAVLLDVGDWFDIRLLYADIFNIPPTEGLTYSQHGSYFPPEFTTIPYSKGDVKRYLRHKYGDFRL